MKLCEGGRVDVDLSGKVALVTGGSRGIGRACVLKLASMGAAVAVVSTSLEGSQRVVSEVEAAGGTGLALAGNVACFADAEEWVKTTVERLGGLDILVCNAGITRDMLVMRMSPEKWQEVIDVNLTGTFNLIRAAIPVMIKRKSGRIITISSVSGLTGNPGQANYSASKAGVVGLSKAVAREVASRGITVNVVAPGLIDTDMTKDLAEKAKEALLQRVPMGRMGSPEDVAAAVAFLASPAASYITGHVLCVDGGMTM